MIEITVENGVAEIVLDAPQRMNALDEACLLYTSPSPRDRG